MATEEIRILLKLSGPGLDRDEIIVGRQGLRAGRSSDNQLVLNHREISRQHFHIFWREDDKYLIEDLNSSNGVYLNDVRLVERVPAELNIGDVIRAGPFVIRVDSLIYAAIETNFQRRPDDEPNATAYPAGGIVPASARERASASYYAEHIMGVPRDRSTWMTNLPAVFHDDDFIGRFLLIFESIYSRYDWMIDNFDLYLTPQIAPVEWLQWMASWFDLLLLPDLPEERQRRIMVQVGWLFLRRGTPSGLKRLLELYFDVTPEIIEREACHFTVRLPIAGLPNSPGREVADRLINSQRPAFASYTLEII